jgi:hypothetical protein
MAYGALELGQAGKPPCPNAFEEASTLLCPGSTRLRLQVSVAAVFVQFGVFRDRAGGTLGGIDWQTEMPFLPIVASLGENFDAVRVRNYTPNVAAQVLASVSAT